MPTRILCHHTYPKTDGLQYSLAFTHKLTCIPSYASRTIQTIFEEAVAAQMLHQAVTNQANQETAIPIEITPPSPLQQKFDALVMCNFTPRKPSELPVSRWVSCD